MATSFGALCTDFYINQRLGLKMDLPTERETILHFFDRIRADQPTMKRFRRYSDELALESSARDAVYRWMALRTSSIRAGFVNPETLEEAYDLHRLILKICPFHLSISPLDVEVQELTFGFDLEAKANQNEVVYDALLAETPLGSLLEYPGATPLDVQPALGITLNEECDLQAFFEVATTTSNKQIRLNRFRTEPISVWVTVRKLGPIDKPEDLLERFDVLGQYCEQLATEKAIPDLIQPISRALTRSA